MLHQEFERPVAFYASGRLEIIGVCFLWTDFGLLRLAAGGKGSCGVRIFEHPIAGLHPGLDEWVRTGDFA